MILKVGFKVLLLSLFLSACIERPKENCKCGDGGVKIIFKEKKSPLKYTDDQTKIAYEGIKRQIVYVKDLRHKRVLCYAILVHTSNVNGITSVLCEDIDPNKTIKLEYPSVKGVK